MSKNKKYRSSDWFNSKSHRRDTFVHRGWMRNQGHPNHLFDGRPVIGICNTWSELTPCNGHFRDIAEYVRRGVYEAGGFPLEFPVFSASESNLRPTAMLFRNLASMDVEEAIRGNPMDGVVLLMGCDKTTPSLLMGAASCDLPTIGVSGGPMLNGQHQGDTIGSGTGVWKLDADLNAGLISEDDFVEAEISMSRSKGHCMTMGTASTMASMVESLGMALPHNAAIPAVDARRYSNAFHSGKRIVEMVKENLIMSKIVTKESFENAIKVNGAVGGSTNAVIHMAAIAGRMEIDLTLDDWERCGKEVPTLVNLQPSGTYLMEDFYYAGLWLKNFHSQNRQSDEISRLYGDANPSHFFINKEEKIVTAIDPGLPYGKIDNIYIDLARFTIDTIKNIKIIRKKSLYLADRRLIPL